MSRELFEFDQLLDYLAGLLGWSANASQSSLASLSTRPIKREACWLSVCHFYFRTHRQPNADVVAVNLKPAAANSFTAPLMAEKDSRHVPLAIPGWQLVVFFACPNAGRGILPIRAGRARIRQAG